MYYWNNDSQGTKKEDINGEMVCCIKEGEWKFLINQIALTGNSGQVLTSLKVNALTIVRHKTLLNAWANSPLIL